MALIAQMVVKDEEDRYLREVLEHLSSFVNKIVITDDVSNDNTVAVCREYTDYVYELDEPLFCVNEGQLRQKAWDNLDNHAKDGDWILCIDADEKVWETTNTLEAILKQDYYHVIALAFTNMWNPTQYRTDKFWGPTNCTKLFRWQPNGKIQDKQLACGSEPTYIHKWMPKRFFANSGLIIQHLGYMRDEDKQAKYDRYMEIDGGKYHSGSHLKSILDPKPILKDWRYEYNTLERK
jgi:hypothetical protein